MLTQDIDGETYCTYLYLYNGYLKELFTQQGNALGGSSLDAGINIMGLDSFQIEQVSPRLLAIDMATNQGESYKIYVSTHCNVQ